MNNCIYDPILGRFLSPDPYIQAPEYAQNFNRYSYVFNNPLKYIDPSGYFSLPWSGIGFKRWAYLQWQKIRRDRIWTGDPDAGKTFSFNDVGVGPRIGASISIEETNWWYVGSNISNFNISNFNGIRQEIEGSYSLFGAGCIWTELDGCGGRLLGIKFTVGAGSPIGVGYNKGNTYVH